MADWQRTSDGRLRAPWRLLVALVSVVSAGAVASVLAVASGVATPDAATDPFALVGSQAMVGLAIGAAVVATARYVDRRSLEAFGLSIDRPWWRDLAAGLAIGFGLVAVLYLVGVVLGVYTPSLDPNAPDGYTLAAAFVLVATFVVVVGIYEELLFRGYLLSNIADGLTAVLGTNQAVLGAVVLSSIGFGLVHGLNPGMTALGVATITVAGVALAAGYVLTGRLALPIGFHITWNLAHFVFGLPVSGIDVGIRLFATERSGSALVHGGSVGPEGGVLGLAAALAGCVVVLAYARLARDGPAVAPTILYAEVADDRSGPADR